MHPQVWQSTPGSCPICGMALEPLEPTLEEGPNPELIVMNRRMWVCPSLSVPLLLLTMGAELLDLRLVPVRMLMWLQFALAMPMVLHYVGENPACRHKPFVRGEASLPCP